MRLKALVEIYTMHSFAQLQTHIFFKIVANFANFFCNKCLLKKNWDCRAVQRSALCRSRRELSNAFLVAKFGFDTAENEPSKVYHPTLPIFKQRAVGQPARGTRRSRACGRCGSARPRRRADSASGAPFLRPIFPSIPKNAWKFLEVHTKFIGFRQFSGMSRNSSKNPWLSKNS